MESSHVYVFTLWLETYSGIISVQGYEPYHTKSATKVNIDCKGLSYVQHVTYDMTDTV